MINDREALAQYWDLLGYHERAEANRRYSRLLAMPWWKRLFHPFEAHEARSALLDAIRKGPFYTVTISATEFHEIDARRLRAVDVPPRDPAARPDSEVH